jgi:hypothetical protein
LVPGIVAKKHSRYAVRSTLTGVADSIVDDSLGAYGTAQGHLRLFVAAATPMISKQNVIRFKMAREVASNPGARLVSNYELTAGDDNEMEARVS